MNDLPENREELESMSQQIIEIARNKHQSYLDQISQINSAEIQSSDGHISADMIITRISEIVDLEVYYENINYILWYLSDLDGAFANAKTENIPHSTILINHANIQHTLSIVHGINQMIIPDGVNYKIVQDNFAKLMINMPWIVCIRDFVSNLPIYTLLQETEGNLSDDFHSTDDAFILYQMTSNPTHMVEMLMSLKNGQTSLIFNSEYFLNLPEVEREQVREKYNLEYNKAKKIIESVYFDLFKL